MIDTHCHILWGIDDASKYRSQSIDMLRVAQADGITHVIATPHVKEPIFYNDKTIIKNAYENLLSAIKEEGINIEVFMGAENYLAHHTIHLLHKNELLPLGNTKYMLVEFSWTKNMKDDPTSYIKQVIQAGYIPVVAHPERYEWVHKDYSIIKTWRDLGCLMQVNRTSVLGLDNLLMANEYATKMLDDDLVDIIASDAHHSYSPRLPKLSDAYHYIEKKYGEQKAKLYFIDNPSKFIK